MCTNSFKKNNHERKISHFNPMFVAARVIYAKDLRRSRDPTNERSVIKDKGLGIDEYACVLHSYVKESRQSMNVF